MELEDSAIVALEKLIYFFPEQFENYGMLAEYLTEINQFEKSREVYKELLDREPDNGLANLSYGDFFFKQGKSDSALFYYKRGFEAKDIALEDKIGILYNYMYGEDVVGADSAFIFPLVDVLVEKHKDPTPYALSAEYYVKKQDYTNAANVLKKAIDLGSENYIIWEQYIMISNFLENHEDVKEVYSKAIEKFPGKINLYIFSGYSLYSAGEIDKILALEEGGLAIENVELQEKVQFMNLLADAYRSKEKYSISDSIYENILVIDPENLLIRNNYSYYLSVREVNLERAEELSRLTIKKEPKNATYLDTYGWILYKQGKSKEALKFIELAIKNGAYNNSEVLEHYGDIMFALDRCKEAIEAWTEAIKYDLDQKEKINIKIESALINCDE
jgi:Tfp pilus assembly protein PilF